MLERFVNTRMVVNGIVVGFSVLLAACGGIGDSAPKQLVVENHWGGNTGGRAYDEVNGGAISNFVVDIATLKSAQTGHSDWAPLIITKSYWDETGWGDGGYAAGKRVTKGEFFYEYHDDTKWPGIAFDTTTYNGITATIEHPHVLYTPPDPPPETFTPQQIKDIRQQNAEDQGQPLKDYQDNLPYVQLIRNGTIRKIMQDVVSYPTGVAFDDAGRLWVSDNGPDQNFKIFDVPATGTPTVVDTFGVKGGVFAGPIPGLTGEKRFWGVRGVGFGDDSEIIVGTSGIPGQIHGGTDIRAFDKLRNFLWDLKSIFMHSPDIDPTSSGTQIYTAAQRFEMDYTKPPGESWKQAAVTLDPFRYPGDPRLIYPYNIAFVRVVQGKKFLFVSDMGGFGLGVYRFANNSEIAIPTAFLGIGGNQRGEGWTQGREPAWTGEGEANNSRRLMWRDANGNGAVDTGEFVESPSLQMPFPYATGIDIDDNGNIWVAGMFNEHNHGQNYGGNLMIPFGDIDAKGVPFKNSVPEYVDIPQDLILPEDRGQTSSRMRYLAPSDTLVMVRGVREDYYSTRIYVIDGYQRSGNPRLRFKLDLGYDDKGAEIIDIVNNPDHELIESMVLPTVVAADEDYLYVGYIENGLDAHVRGEITVYSMVDGHKIGWIVPGEDTNHFSGNFDMRIGIQVRKLADGTRIITAEEGGGGKFMVYRWKP